MQVDQGVVKDGLAVEVTGSTQTGGYTSISNFRAVVTTAGTAVPLFALSTPCKAIQITGLEGNVGIVVFGGSTVVADLATRSGTPLYQSQPATIYIDDGAKIYLDAVNDGDGISGTIYA